ncbi:MAG: TraX family protein [Eubacteriaceae bacterium]
MMEYLYSSNLHAIFFINYQWMMIVALPLMLLYNGEKGRGLKYLFYLFYPLHITILFLIGNVWM